MNAASLPFEDARSDDTFWHGHECCQLQEAIVAGVPHMFYQVLDPLWDYEEAM